MDFFRQSLKYARVCVCVCVRARAYSQLHSCVLLFVAPWTVALQAPLSMGFSRQEYRSRLPFLLQGILKITIVAIYYNEYIDVYQQCLKFTHKVKCGRETLLWVGVDSAGTVRNFNSQAVKKKKIEAVN